MTTAPGEHDAGRRTFTHDVELVPREGQTEASIQADLDRSEALARRLLDEGVEFWRSRYRWWGPVKALAYKEVGPPPWRFPRIGVKGHRKPATVRFIVGWRSTAFAIIFMWAPRHSGGDAR